MANPTYQGNGGLGTQAAGTGNNLIVALPSGIASGDILIASILCTDNFTTSTPSGWTLIQTVLGSSGNFSHSTLWRRATSAESGNVAFTNTGSWAGLFAGVIHRFTGCIETGTPYESLLVFPTSTPTTGSTKAITPTAPTGAERLGIVVAYAEDDTAISIAGTGWTQQNLLQTAVGTGCEIGLATKNLNSGDSVGTVTLTLSGSVTYSALVSMMLLPAATLLNDVKINVGDVWKSMAGAKINIGDVWKTVASIKINVGDTWKTVI